VSDEPIHPTPAPVHPRIPDVRLQTVKWALYLVNHKKRCLYTEGPERMEAIGKPAGSLPFEGDCSSTFTVCYDWAGAHDPNGLNFDGYGDTDTLLEHAKRITIEEVQVGDGVIFGLSPTRHIAMIVKLNGGNPLCMSNGGSSDPSLFPLSVVQEGVFRFWGGDSNVMTFCRYDTRNRHL
jgi:hypothetical protein